MGDSLVKKIKIKLHPLRSFLVPNWGHSTLVLPWYPARKNKDNLNKLKRQVAQDAWDQSGFLGKTALLGLAVSWPVLSIGCSLPLVCRLGGITRKVTGIGRMKQLWYCWKLATFHGLQPEEYYKYRAFTQGDFSDAPHYVHNPTIVALHQRLHKGLDIGVLDDKFRFYQFFSARGLAVIPVYALAVGGKIEWRNEDFEENLPHVDLFIKPHNYYRGGFTELWRASEQPGLWKRKNRELNEQQLIEHLADLSSSGRNFLLQKCLRNSDQLKKLSPNALATVRLVTYRFPDGKPAPLASRLAIPIGNLHTDHDAMGAGVDLESGELTPAIFEFLVPEVLAQIDRSRAMAEWHTHPDTGAQITGEKIEGWQDMVNLCIEAHACLEHLPFVGWDVAMTEKGAVLVEGNSTWGHTSSQVARKIPLGMTPFADCYLANYRHRFPRSPEVD